MHYYVVDVFSDKPFMGNPVAVVMCDQDLTSAQMQQMAAWLNLSETTFVSNFQPQTGQYSVRIFSPEGEMPFAGHPTLGTAVAVRKHYQYTASDMLQDCPAGLVALRFDDANGSVHLVSPDTKLHNITEQHSQQLAEALGLKQSADIICAAKLDAGPMWVTALLNSAQTVAQLQPDQGLIEALSSDMQATGIVVGALQEDGETYKVRTFAPAVGVPEDPVCGSGNVAVAYLRRHDGQGSDNYQSQQGQEVGRDGAIQIAYLAEQQIELGGKTYITCEGDIAVPHI